MSPADPVDDYVPGHGDLSYDVCHYDLSLEYRVETNALLAKATLSAVALTATDRVVLDLEGLRVSKVLLDGAVVRFTHRAGRLVVKTGTRLRAGQEFRVQVAYQGTPLPVHGIDGEAGWEELSDGVIVASQPHGAPSWFPCNDRPSNKASYRIKVAAESAYHVTANGSLVDHRRGASRTTWVFDQAEPMASYLASVQIGRYSEQVLATAPTRVIAVRSAATASRAALALARQPEMMLVYSQLFGRYPFAHYTVVVTDDALEIPLEAQGMAAFGSNHARTDWDAERLVAHELAHQWFGNSLTLGVWRDIWLHEGFACYAEWLWSERSGGPSAQHHAERHWRQLSRLPQDLVLADPGPESMFDDRVYKRGALTLHALRRAAGDGPFFDLLRSWCEQNEHGTVSTGMFSAHVHECMGSGPSALLDAWLFRAPLPPLDQTVAPGTGPTANA